MDRPAGSPAAPDLQLAAGLRVVARGRDHLQVGLHDGRRLVLPRTRAVEDAVEALVAPRPLDLDLPAGSVLERLRRHGCAVSRGEEAARTRQRREGRVAILGNLAGIEAGALLATAGVPVLRSAGSDDETLGRADVALVLSSGEIARERLDPLVRRGTSHVVVRLVDGAALVGPFVVPGQTACLRCIDAHLSINDPDHVAVTSRYVRATARPRADGVPDVADPALTVVAVAWAARDIGAYLEGRTPSTWSRTLLLDREPTRRIEQDWSRHPQCGCCWSAMGPWSGTMGA